MCWKPISNSCRNSLASPALPAWAGAPHGGRPHALGMIDYWEDRDGLSYSVKGWIDPNFLSVMYIYGEGDYPSFNLQEMYLNGFRFPGK